MPLSEGRAEKRQHTQTLEESGTEKTSESFPRGRGATSQIPANEPSDRPCFSELDMVYRGEKKNHSSTNNVIHLVRFRRLMNDVRLWNTGEKVRKDTQPTVYQVPR